MLFFDLKVIILFYNLYFHQGNVLWKVFLRPLKYIHPNYQKRSGSLHLLKQ